MFESASFGMRAVIASALVHGTIVAVVAAEVPAAPLPATPSGPPSLTLLDVVREPLPVIVAAPPEPPALLPVALPTLTPRMHVTSVRSPPSVASTASPTNDAKPLAAAPPEAVTGPTAPPSFTMAMPVITNGSGSTRSAPVVSGNATPEAKVLDESGASALADRLYGPSPSYPLEAQRARVEADIPLLILVDTTGRVVDVRVERPAGYGLDEAAEKAVRQWTFRPRRVDGEPVAVRVQWTMQFHLD